MVGRQGGWDFLYLDPEYEQFSHFVVVVEMQCHVGCGL